MANKTTSNPKSQEQSMKIVVQSQLARIKKEEEEELWISGEELYTEGSSDEEDYKAQSRSRRKVNSNQSTRASSTNRSIERRSLPSISTGIKAKSDHSIDEISEQTLMLKNVLTFDEQSFKYFDRSSSIKSHSTERLPTVKSSTTSITRDSSNFLTEDDQIENREISWKAKRELLYNNKELLDDEYEDDTDTLSIDTEDEYMRKEVLEVKNLDNLIRAMNDKVKKASEETLFHQCKNRKRLDQILTLNPSETGKLAENTRQFLYLCPGYAMLNAEFQERHESYISLEMNDSERQIFQNGDNVNLDVKYLEDMDDEMQDPSSNPYLANKEITEMLLAVEEEVRQQNLYNEQEQSLEKYDSPSYTNSIISISDTTSTIQNSQDTDDCLDKVVQEMGQLSIVHVVEDKPHETDKFS